MIVEGRFTRQYNKCGYVARIVLELEESALPTQITIMADATPNYNSTHDASIKIREAYWDWKQGAITGIKYALSKVNTTKQYIILVRQIIGQAVDTNATIVAAAAMDGVWKALNYQPSPTEWEMIEKIVYISWKKEPFNLPTDFEIE